MAGRESSLSGRSALDVLCLWPFFTGHEFKINALALAQSLVTLAHNRGMVDEDILPRLLGDEAKTQPVVEPLHFATSHNLYPSMSKYGGGEQKGRTPSAPRLP